MTLPQLLELGMSGVAFAGSDVGGYSGREPIGVERGLAHERKDFAGMWV